MRAVPCLALLLALGTLRADHELSLDPKLWGAQPAWNGPAVAEQWDLTADGGVATFHASGKGGTMVWLQPFDPPLDLTGLRLLTLRYRAENIDPELFSYFLFLTNANDGRMLAERLATGANDLIVDGRWHTLTTSLRITKQVTQAAIRFRALPGKAGTVQLSRLAITAEPPRFALADSLPWRPGVAPQVGTPVELTGCATPLPAVQKALALSDWFTAPQVTVAGIPFRVAITGAVALSTPFEQPITQTVSTTISTRAPGLYLLLGSELSYQLLTYDAWQPGDRIDQPSRFAVEVHYADGTVDAYSPFCLDQDGYGIWRGLHVYRIPTADKPIARLVLRDGMRFGAFHLLAVTAAADWVPNESHAALMPPVAALPPDEPASDMGGNPLGERVVPAGEGYVTIYDGQPPRLQLSSALATRLSSTKRPLFTVREGERRWTAEDFKPDGHGPWVCPAAGLAARLTVRGGRRQATIALALQNLSDQPRNLAVTFPELGLTSEQPAELQYALTRSVLMLGTANRLYRTPYGGSYPLQWMDFSDGHGGVTIATRTTDPWMRTYEGGKLDDGTALARVEYLDNRPVAPGAWLELPPATIAFHQGDWHAALAADRAWRATWDQPVKPRPAWFTHTWHLRTHWTHTLGDGRAELNWLDKATGKLHPDDLVDRDLREFGAIDYVHLFDWRDSPQFGTWGDYNHVEHLGGMAAFKAAIERVKARGIRVGLYFDLYQASAKSDVGKAHGAEWVVKDAAGRPGDSYSTPNEGMYNMCVNHPGWQDFLAQRTAEIQRETGCDGIYLDEGGFTMPQYDCWRTDHPHARPATTLEGDLATFRKVREALPAEVALYTEYCPADIITPTLSGAYMASLGRADPSWSPGYLNLSRFAFPGLKLFLITNGGNSIDGIEDGFKYSLFNGMALYSLAWGHSPETNALLQKLYPLLKQHEAAFGSPNPEPLVPEAVPPIYANRFPGPTQTVYTLWNSAHRTARGVVLRLPHVRGATYLDAWNGRLLAPRIERQTALIELELGPREVGMVVQNRPWGPVITGGWDF